MKHPARLRTDQGTEFKNKTMLAFLTHEGINHILAFNPDVKAAIVERWIRTLKTRLAKYMTQHQLESFHSYQHMTKVLSDLVKSYNTRFHSTLGMAPMQVNLKTKNKIRIKKQLKTLKHDKFLIGDKVRITSYKNVFSKGYVNNFTSSPFTIIRKSINTPRMYTLTDQNGELIEGRFYAQELLPYYGK